MELREEAGLGPAQTGDGAQTEAAGQPALLAEIRDLLLAQNAHKKRQTALLRLCAAAAAIVALAAVVTAAVLLPKAADTLAQAGAAIAALDMQVVSRMLEELDTVAGESIAVARDAAVVLEQIAALDFAALNAVLEDMDGAVETIANLDIATLNDAIKNLNDTVAPLAELLNSFR